MNIILIVLLYSSFYISNIYGESCEVRLGTTPQMCADLTPSPESPCGCACGQPDANADGNCDNTGDGDARCKSLTFCPPTQTPTQIPTRSTQTPTQIPTRSTQIPTI
eukprot:285104_1